MEGDSCLRGIDYSEQWKADQEQVWSYRRVISLVKHKIYLQNLTWVMWGGVLVIEAECVCMCAGGGAGRVKVRKKRRQRQSKKK